ncbi:two-component regulator propeller domain-containing protein [Spirosoma utsteinense]|uniref:histidine kinase n=1 Tax=Spirosoma utsteinense TaxID=2585773 RepID=A0ABR6WEM1_9BACT|nr:two-component regulator propeller domain-containing protein [Spirosoma utsteinense]MBC3788488.1 ligand-binding sensor domain-containing protein [Spirosoma utsteinense]MBC3794456.1 ligand-binding sensor domain-containing protein/AraC-like DNA-binding protein [Spirosoma utsteinense]
MKYKFQIKCIALIIKLLFFDCRISNAQQFHFNALTSEQGLSHNSVFSITQDHKGFVWFGTRDGVSRYDSQRIKNYYLNAYSPNAEAARVNCVYSVGHELWVGTATGLFRYVFDTDEFVPVYLAKNPVNVLIIQRVSTGELWIGSRDGLYILPKREGAIRHILPGRFTHGIHEFRKGSFLILQNNTPCLINAAGETIVTLAMIGGNPEKSHVHRNHKLLKSRRGAVWMSTETDLLQLDENLMVFRSLEWFGRLVKDRIRVVRTITEDHAGNVWIGGESGVIMVDSQRQTARAFDKSFTASPYGLTDRAVYSSYVSRDGMVWLGTYFGGVNYTKPVGVSFEHLFPATDGQTIAGKAISEITIDGQERLWVGTEDGGISVQNRITGRYTYHNRSNGLSDNNVHAISIDKSGAAWVGTFLGGLNRVDPVTGEKRVFLHNPDDPASLASNYVNALYRDQAGQLWVGTTRGLNILDEKTGTFRLFKPQELGEPFIIDILGDTSGQIWIATSPSGVYRYDPELDKLTHYDASNTPVLRSNQIMSIFEDSGHNMWFGSLNGGVYQWNYRQKKFIWHPTQAHLANQTVYETLEDNYGTYWFSTNNGLLSFSPKQNTYRVFDESNGLQATQFNFRSALKDRRGYLYFGSVDGLCYFNPDNIAKRVFDPPVYFTDLKLFSKEVKADSKLMLTNCLDETNELRFDYAQNVITFDFVAINYFSKQTNYYTYYLEGFEKTWGPKTTVNAQTYTNLSPGNYTFHVKSFQSNGDLSPTERILHIIVNPPFWRTNWAYLLYALFGVGLLVLYRRVITYLNRQKVAVQIERVEREKSEELNQQKLNFFTFLSNEFKTPITLIMAEVDELIQSNQAWRADSAINYSVIKKNARRLHVLIDQITALRKTGSDVQEIRLTDLDIIAFIKETVQGFDPFIQSKHIRRRLTFSPPYLMASFDAGKVEMIVGNVLFFLTNEATEGDELAIDVRIEKLLDYELSIIFSLEGRPDLFKSIEATYQIAEDDEELFRQDNSSSVGILLTFSLLKLLSGTVSFIDEGTRQGLSLRFPICKSPVSKAPAVLPKTDLLRVHVLAEPDGLLPENIVVKELLDGTSLTGKPTILIIDRSNDLVQFLKRHYHDTYHIRIAYTFSEALKKAENMLPEIILCDGDIRDKEDKNLCLALKSNPLTESIPVILLLNDKDDKTIIEGLYSGADGYISKPFNLKELDLIIGNQLTSVSLLKKKLADGFGDSLLTKLPRRNKEQEFIMRFSTLVNHHYKNKDITSDSLAHLMNCSRSQLHTKLKTLTGLSTKEYLNDYRLNLARQLLESGLSVAETAFEVGFGDPNYFGRAFKMKYGMTPSKAS